MKKILAVLCAVCLLAGCALPASAAGLRDMLNDMLALVQKEDEAPKADAAPAEGRGPSLLKKRVTIAREEVPEEAFRESTEVCTAVSPRGNRLLICGGTEPGLWDPETKERIPLFLGDGDTKALVRDFLEKQAAKQPKLVVHGEDGALFSAFVTSAQFLRRQPAMRFIPDYPVNESTPFLRVTDNCAGIPFLLDTETGALYADAEGECIAVHDGVMLIRSYPPSGAIQLKDMKTGKKTKIDFARLSGLEGAAALTAAQFLPDGSICAVLRAGKLDPKKGEACAAVIRSPQGKTAVYPLGMIRLGREPDRIFSAGAGQIVLFSRQALQAVCPYGIDRARGEVSLLTCDGKRVRAVALADCMDADGQITQPEGVPFLTYGPWGNGETLLIHRFDGSLLLFRPGTMETERLLSSGEEFGLMTFSYFSGNGYDRLAGKPERSYYRLAVR